MTFPAPDTGHASFPGPDTGHAIFPGPDGGVGVFPPQPIPLRVAETTVIVVAGADWVIVPVRTAEVVAGLSASAVVVPVPEIVADVVAVVDVQATRDYDNIDADVLVDATADAIVAHSVELGAPRYTTGSGGELADFAPTWFTATNDYSSTYRLYAAGLDWTKPVGLLVHFHGDGAYEYNNPTDPWSLGGPSGIIARAKAENMLVLVPLTPDDDGAVTWWEWWGPDENPQYAIDLISAITSAYNLDLGRVWFSGYSGGAQFVTRDLMPALGAILAGIVGGFVAFGGGGAPRREAETSAAGWWQCHWVVGELDDGTEPGDGFNARLAAEQGEAWYRERGFPTQLTVLPGEGHDLGGLFGGHVGDTLAAHRPAYGPGVGVDATASADLEVMAILDADVSVDVEVVASALIEGYVTAQTVVDVSAAATLAPVIAIDANVSVDVTASTDAVVSHFSTQGAYLSANQTIGGYSSAFFSPLAPLPAYPGSVASGSTLTVVGGGPATIVGTFAAIGAWQAINLYRNGTKIVPGASSTSPISWSGTLADGDQIQLEVVYSNGGSLPVTAGTTNVTLTVTPT